MRTTLPVVLVLTALGAPGAQILVEDARNLDVHNSSRHYSMAKFTSREAWQARAAFLRKQSLGDAGLLPMPEKRPTHADVLGKIERDRYTIERFRWRRGRGGGDLHRPSGKRRPFPAVVSPHGHWHYDGWRTSSLFPCPADASTWRCRDSSFSPTTYPANNDTDQLSHHWCNRQRDLWNINPLGVRVWDSIHDASPDFPPMGEAERANRRI